MDIFGGTAFMPKTGGTFTGPVTISTSQSNALLLNRADGAGNCNLVFQQSGATVAYIAQANAEPKINILDSGATPRLQLRSDTGVISTALAPYAVIGATGSITANSIGTGAVGTPLITPSFLNSNTFLTYSVRNSVSVNNNGGGISFPCNTTDIANMVCSFNTDSTVSYLQSNPGTGNIRLVGKNTNASTANLTFEWGAVGR